MDENTWRLAQIFMWLIGLQTVVLGGIFAFLWNNLSKRIEDLSNKIDANEAKFNAKIEALDAKLSARIEEVYSKLSAKIEAVDAKLSARIDALDTKLCARIDVLQHSLNELDKRVYGIETVLHMKDCCVLKQDQNLKKAE